MRQRRFADPGQVLDQQMAGVGLVLFARLGRERGSGREGLVAALLQRFVRRAGAR